MIVFNPRQHFASGQVAKCCRCEALAESSWPSGWLMTSDGFYCPSCTDRLLGLGADETDGEML